MPDKEGDGVFTIEFSSQGARLLECSRALGLGCRVTLVSVRCVLDFLPQTKTTLTTGAYSIAAAGSGGPRLPMWLADVVGSFSLACVFVLGRYVLVHYNFTANA